MRIKTPERLGQCKKPNCDGRFTHRHHKGCETIVLRAFARFAKQKRFKAFLKRYKEFRAYDTVEICVAHHEEIHWIYGALIMKEIKKRGYRKLQGWTWKEHMELIQILRDFCDEWVKKETPGMKLKKFAFTKPVNR